MSVPVLWTYDLDEACYAARLTAALAGAEVTLRAVDVVPGAETGSAAFRALSPMGRVPVLVDGKVVLTQTEAILTDLARRGERGAALLPDTPEALDWLIFAARDLSAAGRARAAALFGTGDARAAGEARAALLVLEDRLTAQGLRGAGFVAGNTPGVADLALFPGFALSRDWGLGHEAFPALRLWARRIRMLPGFVGMPGLPAFP